MFEIIEERQNDIDRLKILNKRTGEYVSIVPQFGANVNEIVLKEGDKLYGIIDGNKNSASFKNMGIYKNAVLMPFPNRLKDGRYTFNGMAYELHQNYQREGNAAHGFIYDKPFKVNGKTIGKTEARLFLKYDYDGSISGYPFPFEVRLEYKLCAEKGFQCKTDVCNLSETDMPFGSGWHPFFTFGKPVDKLKLKFSVENHIIFDSGLLPTGLKKKYNRFDNYSVIGARPLDSCFKLSGTSGRHHTELVDEDEDIKIVLWQETGHTKYNFLQLYIPPSRKSIAIEPMTCNVDAFNNHDGLIILKKGHTFSAGYGVQLKPANLRSII